MPSGSRRQEPLDLESRDSLFGLAHEVDGGEPLAKGKVGIVHDGPGSDAELVSATTAIPLPTALNLSDGHIAAPGAGNPIGPAQFLKTLAALLSAVEKFKQGDEIHGSVLQETKAAKKKDA